MPWSGQLAAPVAADDQIINVTPPYLTTRWGTLLVIDPAGTPSVISVRGASSGGAVLYVTRGMFGTDGTAYPAGTAIQVWSVASTAANGEHPNLAAHDSLGLATQAELDTHAAGPHGGGAHPDLATHDGLGLATDVELATHAATAHGTQNHAISGASHTGTLDHAALSNQTANQHHNQAHAIGGADHSGSLNHSALGSVSADQHHTESHAARHATGQPDALTAANIGAEASGAVATHAGAADPHTGYLQESAHNAAAHTSFTELATQSELDAHAATSHGVTAHGSLTGVTADQHHARQHSITSASDHTFPGGSTFLRADGTFAIPPGGSEAFPVGSVFLSVVTTNPATLLGYGTWAAIAAGRMLAGFDSGQGGFDTDEETGGASTHTHADHTGVINHTHPVTDPGHTHLTQRYPTATGGSSGFTIDTSMSGTLADNTLPTKTATTGVTTTNPAGGVAALTHDSLSHLPPYFVVHIWKRTA